MRWRRRARARRAAFCGARRGPHHRGAPRAIDVAVAYPEAAHGDAVVVLRARLAPDGHVVECARSRGRRAVLRRSQGGRGAVSHSSRRRATAIRSPRACASRFHFTSRSCVRPARVEVVEHRARPNQSLSHQFAEDVEDVHVRGMRKEVGGTSMTKEDVRDMPGAFGDAFRAIDMMPGVTPIISGAAVLLRARRAARKHRLLHRRRPRAAALSPRARAERHPPVAHRSRRLLSGRLSRAVRAFHGRHRRRARRAGRTSTLGGEAEIRLFDAGVLGETPFARARETCSSRVATGIRRCSSALRAEHAARVLGLPRAHLVSRAPRDTLTAFVFGSFDELDQREPALRHAAATSTSCPFYPLFRTEFHRADLRWDHAVPGGNLRTALTLGIDDSLVGGGFGAFRRVVQARASSSGAELDETLSKTLRARAGADVLLYHYDYSRLAVARRSDSRIRRATTSMFGGYADVVWRVHPRIEIVPGLALRRVHVALGRSVYPARRSQPRDGRQGRRLAPRSIRASPRASHQQALHVGRHARPHAPAPELRRTHSGRRARVALERPSERGAGEPGVRGEAPVRHRAQGHVLHAATTST